eukprot:1159945-Pelagomonas_calceolata.AAC.4
MHTIVGAVYRAGKFKPSGNPKKNKNLRLGRRPNQVGFTTLTCRLPPYSSLPYPSCQTTFDVVGAAFAVKHMHLALTP